MKQIWDKSNPPRQKLVFSGEDLENIVWENQEALKARYSGKDVTGASIEGFLELWQDWEYLEDCHSFNNKDHIGPHESSEAWYKLQNLIPHLVKLNSAAKA